MPALLSGEIAIVTGSSGLGTGSEIARVFGDEGACVVVTGRNGVRGEQVAASIIDAGGQAMFVRADLSSPAECAALVERTVDAWGTVSVLVHSAVAMKGDVHASTHDAPVGAVSDEVWVRNMQINLTSFLWLCRKILPVMEAAGRGSIVNIGSRAAERGTPERSAYTASKGAVHALVRSIAVDYARLGIRANTVAAGFIDGKDRQPISAETRSWAERMHLTRVPTTTDVAYAAAYLASPLSGSITGHTLPVDGGSSIARAASL